MIDSALAFFAPPAPMAASAKTASVAISKTGKDDTGFADALAQSSGQNTARIELESAGGSPPVVPASTAKDEVAGETATDATAISADVALMIAISVTEGVVTAGGIQPAVSANAVLPTLPMPPTPPVSSVSTGPAVPSTIEDGKTANLSGANLGSGKSATAALKPATQEHAVDAMFNAAADDGTTAATTTVEPGNNAPPVVTVSGKSVKPAGGMPNGDSNASAAARQDMLLPSPTPASPPTAGARQPASSPPSSAISGRSEFRGQPTIAAEGTAPPAPAKAATLTAEASARPPADMPQPASQDLTTPASIAFTATGHSGMVHTGNSVMPIILVPTHVENPGWSKDFGQHVIRLAVEGQPAAEIHLNPPELGPIRVSIEMKGQDATLQFVAAHPQTREALEGSMPRLRELFAGGNISLASADVASQSFSEQSFSSNGQRFPQPSAGGLNPHNSRTATIEDAIPALTPAARPSASRSRVDLFA